MCILSSIREQKGHMASKRAQLERLILSRFFQIQVMDQARRRYGPMKDGEREEGGRGISQMGSGKRRKNREGKNVYGRKAGGNGREK